MAKKKPKEEKHSGNISGGRKFQGYTWGHKKSWNRKDDRTKNNEK